VESALPAGSRPSFRNEKVCGVSHAIETSENKRSLAYKPSCFNAFIVDVYFGQSRCDSDCLVDYWLLIPVLKWRMSHASEQRL
jgi:hypothetical protein